MFMPSFYKLVFATAGEQMLSGFTGWHVLVLLVFVVPAVLWIIAIMQIAKTRATGTTIALWILIITLIPLVGAILWFAIGKRSAAPQDPRTASTQ
jgi:hypothetical protein